MLVYVPRCNDSLLDDTCFRRADRGEQLLQSQHKHVHSVYNVTFLLMGEHISSHHAA